jgi:DNA repair protein RecN (Recombination protein N)
MLNWIKIKNLALIESTEVEFGDGFNVITGETGAGKSVFLSTLTLLLGGRADKGAIRSGADRCEISAGIQLSSATGPAIKLLLDERGIAIAEDSQLHIRRVITKNSTRNYIDDTPVTLQTLSMLGDMLIDIHGVNDHQSLLKQSAQLEILDRYAGLDKELAKCREICLKLKETELERQKLEANLPSEVEAGHLQMIVEEIEKVSPEPGEDEALSVKHKLAGSAKEIIETASQCVTRLNESDDAIIDQISTVYRLLQDLEAIDPGRPGELAGNCEQIIDASRELAYDIENFASDVELDEEEFARLEERIGGVERLKRRYGPNLENVFAARDDANARLTSWRNAATFRTELKQRVSTLQSELKSAAQKLSAARKQVATGLSQAVCGKLEALGFLKSSLEVAFSEVEPGERGLDRIEIMFSANPGEELRPLRAIASSGEISRVMLALKSVLAAVDAISILVFDEIDVNIGGETAAKVGLELQKLADSHQLLCISHQPQVAAAGQVHFMVEKQEEGGRTTSRIVRLKEQARRGEIIRMLGNGRAAAVHADELLTRQKPKK